MARRRQDVRRAWASALAIALGFHVLVLWAALSLGPSAVPSLQQPAPVQPYFIELQHPQPRPSQEPAAAAAAAAGSRTMPTTSADFGLPTQAAAPPTQTPGPAPSRSAGASELPTTLKFDCQDTRGSRDPCLFRTARRDRLPDEIGKQASIDADKAAFYDRVLQARKEPGNLPFLVCKPSRNGPRHSLKIGPLPCWVVPPQGSLTEEVFVEPIPPKNPDHSPP